MCTASRDRVEKQAPWKRRLENDQMLRPPPHLRETLAKETRQKHWLAMFLRSLLSGACTSWTWCHARGNSFVNSFTVRWRALWRNHVALTQTRERTGEGKKRGREGGCAATSQQTDTGLRKFPGGKLNYWKVFLSRWERDWSVANSAPRRRDSDSWSSRRNCQPFANRGLLAVEFSERFLGDESETRSRVWHFFWTK